MADTLPQLSCTVNDERSGCIGILVIHNRVGGRSCGGVRLVPDISPAEVRSSARTMAYKAAFIGVPMGGAKAAIQIDEDSEGDGGAERRNAERLAAFGAALSGLLRSGAYLPAVDMNCTQEDIERIARGAGSRRTLSKRENRTHVYAAWSCFVSTLAALEDRGIEPREATLAVEGLGKVASEYVRLMAGSGVKLVAFSNRLGALAHERGFDVDDLLEHRATRHDAFITDYPRGEKITHARVLEAPVTVLLPAARAFSIRDDNQRAVGAPIVVCAANAAMETDIERRLVDAGQLVIPDFVANCGGLLGSVLDHEVKPEVIRRVLDRDYRQKVSRLLSRASQTQQSISELAGAEAERRMASWSARDRSWPERIRGKLWSRAPGPMRTRRHERFYEALWRADEAEG